MIDHYLRNRMPFYIWQHKALHYLPLIIIAAKTINEASAGVLYVKRVPLRVGGSF